MEKHQVKHLEGVPETLLIPLYARKIESQRPGGLFVDTRAEEIVAQIDYDFARFAGHSAMPSLAMRVHVVDEFTRAFLGEKPAATVVQLGAGLDSRFERLDNGQAQWLELDLPPIISLRQTLFPGHERRHLVTASVLDFAWFEQVPKEQPVLFVAEGLLYYLEETAVQGLVRALIDRFPAANLIFDGAPRLMARFSHRMGAQTRTSAVRAGGPEAARRKPWLWGMNAGRECLRWDSRLRLVKEYAYTQVKHPDFPAAGRILGRIPLVSKHLSPLVVQLAW